MTSSASRSAPRWKGTTAVVVLPDDERAVSCYQLAAFQLAQPTVVLSPVPVDLKAQHEALSTRQLPVVYLSADLSGPARSAALARISRGGALLVLLNPEGLQAPDIRQALTQSGIALFVVEEAHCASDASHELRARVAALLCGARPHAARLGFAAGDGDHSRRDRDRAARHSRAVGPRCASHDPVVPRARETCRS